MIRVLTSSRIANAPEVHCCDTMLISQEYKQYPENYCKLSINYHKEWQLFYDSILQKMVNMHRKIFKHMEGLFKKVMMHGYEASRSIIRLPEAESAPSPSVQAESTSGESGQIPFLHELGI